MNKFYTYYTTDLDFSPKATYHLIGFCSTHKDYLYRPESIADTKYHLLNYDFNNIQKWSHSVDRHNITMVLYNL